MNRKAIIVAGPNGSGKTTFALEYIKEEAGAVFYDFDIYILGDS